MLRISVIVAGSLFALLMTLPTSIPWAVAVPTAGTIPPAQELRTVEPKAAAPEAFPIPAPAPDRKTITIRGRVVDDATGEPIEYFATQTGRVDPADPGRAAWGSPRAIPSSYTRVNGKMQRHPNPEGAFAEYLDLQDREGRHRLLRILANGYEPEPVLDRPLTPDDAGREIEATVRMRPGRSVVGQVLDHEGRPAAGATLCLIRPSWNSVRVVDEVVGEGSDTGLIDPSVTTVLADEEGRFRLPGLGDAILIGISAPTCHFWTIPVPEPGEEATLRLPEPATLRIPFAIEGDDPEAQLWLAQKQPEELQRRLSVSRNLAVPNGGELVLQDVPAGEYTIWRKKILPIGGETLRPCPVEVRILSVGAGETVEVSYVREGKPITGTAILPEKGAARLLYVAVEPVPNPEEPPIPFRTPWLDMVSCDADGRFRTAHLPPGDYVVHAAGYRHSPRYEPFGQLNDAPNFRGSAPITMPEDGDPPPVRIALTDGRPGVATLTTP